MRHHLNQELKPTTALLAISNHSCASSSITPEEAVRESALVREREREREREQEKSSTFHSLSGLLLADVSESHDGFFFNDSILESSERALPVQPFKEEKARHKIDRSETECEEGTSIDGLFDSSYEFESSCDDLVSSFQQGMENSEKHRSGLQYTPPFRSKHADDGSGRPNSLDRYLATTNSSPLQSDSERGLQLTPKISAMQRRERFIRDDAGNSMPRVGALLPDQADVVVAVEPKRVLTWACDASTNSYKPKARSSRSSRRRRGVVGDLAQPAMHEGQPLVDGTARARTARFLPAASKSASAVDSVTEMLQKTTLTVSDHFCPRHYFVPMKDPLAPPSRNYYYVERRSNTRGGLLNWSCSSISTLHSFAEDPEYENDDDDEDEDYDDILSFAIASHHSHTTTSDERTFASSKSSLVGVPRSKSQRNYFCPSIDMTLWNGCNNPPQQRSVSSTSSSSLFSVKTTSTTTSSSSLDSCVSTNSSLTNHLAAVRARTTTTTTPGDRGGGNRPTTLLKVVTREDGIPKCPKRFRSCSPVLHKNK